jgi:hypothetical protein
MSKSAIAQTPSWDQWHFCVDIAVTPQADDSFEAVYVDFSRLLESGLHSTGTLDENSIRVALLEDGKAGEAVPSRFVKDDDFDATKNAAGTLVFQVGHRVKRDPVQYRVFFDTQKNGVKPAWKNTVEVPEAANLVWNGGFEILSEGYAGANPYENAGSALPRGWWGNLLNSKILANAATSAHGGEHALGFVVPTGITNISILSAPTPYGVRVTPGQSYQFSFWVKGEGLTSEYPLYAFVYWYDKNQEYLNRATIGNLPKTARFDWTRGEASLTVPTDAFFANITVGTYSTTGVLSVDDFAVRLSVPAALANAKMNQ